jgi:hypothetical protein
MADGHRRRITKMASARICCFLLLAVAGLGGIGCHLPRPKTVDSRMIEPQLLAPQLTESEKQVNKSTNATPIRLLDTRARGHIGRGLLHQLPNGELTEDAVWLWSTLPDRYLDTALRMEVASNPDLRLVDTASVSTVGATLLVWDLETSGETRLVGAVEFQVTGADRTIHSKVVQASEPVTGDMPGDLAAVSGHLLRRLASEGLASIAGER